MGKMSWTGLAEWEEVMKISFNTLVINWKE